MPFTPAPVLGARLQPRPTTLSARAAARLADGPLDAITLMRDVCQVAKLQQDAAERMAIALLSSHDEFVQLPSGHWSLRGWVRPDRAIAYSTPDDTGNCASPPAPSLRDVAFAVVDVETTGTRAANGDRITEIAIAQVQGGEVREVYSQLVNPERPIPPYITSLTQISWEMVRDQPVFRQIAPEVGRRLAGHVFVAHNASFDWRFVSEELLRGTATQLSGPKLCTVRLTRALLPQLSRRSLDHVTNYFGISIASRHRAAGDAEATAQVLLRLLDVAADLGIESWPELDRRLHTPAERRSRTAADRRRRAFPHPVSQDDIA